MDIKNLVILVLLVAVAALGYLYWDARHTVVNLPNFKIEAR